MNFTGLTLDQAPPIDAPLRFFLTAPLFGILAAVLLLLSEPGVFESRFSPQSIALVHFFTIGIFGMVMAGALQQMLPVLAGVSLPAARTVAAVSHLMITAGLLGMATGLWLDVGVAALAASVLLGLGFVTLLGAVAMAMRSVEYFTPTVKAMRVALVFAFGTVLLGMHLLASHGIGSIGEMQFPLADVHGSWGIFGFAGILIIGVAFQVLPMFYVTPGFKPFCTRNVVKLIASGLVVWALLALIAPELMWMAKLILLLFFLAFSVVIQLKLSKRRRPVSDVTVWYWRTGGIGLGAGMTLWLAGDFLPYETGMTTAVLIGGMFILSIITGMLYKIVPFLTWFHLNAAGYLSIPTVREMIDERFARLQYAFHMVALLLITGAQFNGAMLAPGAFALLLSFVLLEYNLLKVTATYRKIRKTSPDFFMPPQ